MTSLNLCEIRDISNYTAPVTQTMLDCWRSEQVVGVVVRASLERQSMIDIARAQIAAIQGAGLVALAYPWLYGDQSARGIIQQAVATYPTITDFWPDFEDVASFAGLSVSQRQGWLFECMDELINVQKRGVGLYSARYVFQDLGLDGWTGLASMGCLMWDASYNDLHDLASVPPFCGFSVDAGTIVAHQYAATDACASNVDSSVFRADIILPSPAPAPVSDVHDAQDELNLLDKDIDDYATALHARVEQTRQDLNV